MPPLNIPAKIHHASKALYAAVNPSAINVPKMPHIEVAIFMKRMACFSVASALKYRL